MSENIKCKVLRSFYFNGKPLEKETTVELPRVFALEMKAANKVEIVIPPEAKEGTSQGSDSKQSSSTGKENKNAK